MSVYDRGLRQSLEALIAPTAVRDAVSGRVSERARYFIKARELRALLDVTAIRDRELQAKAWDDCVDRICSTTESGTANNKRFKRANPFRADRLEADQ